ncbi:MAG TPA: tetratricopeptide repeat protein [Candidatus Polarisedimenticolia bacterium]|nr:tetratricopeptide repeat protein [Candidatus Polarisedimenticolia bacterium]
MAFDRAKTLLNAEKFVKTGKLPEAITEFKKLADDNPRDMNIVNKLGDLCVRAGKNQDAIRHFLRIAEFYSGDGFFLKAIAMYKKVSKLDPSNMDCFEKLAGLYQQQGLTIEAKAQYLAVADHFVKAAQFKKAIEVLPKVLEIEPDNIKIRMSLADLLARTGDKDQAAREFCNVARELARKGMFDEAIRVVQKGMKISPGNPDLMSLTLSLSKEAKKNPGDLLATVVEMARANGDNPRSLALLGEAYLSAGKMAEADKVFRKLQGLGDGAPPEVSIALGRFHLSKGEEDQSLDCLARAADRYLEESRAPEAGGLLDEFLRAFPQHRGGLTKRAAIAAQAGDTKGQIEALHQLAQVLVGLSETGAAAEVVGTLQSLDPGNARYGELLTGLKGRVGGGASRPAAPRGPAAGGAIPVSPAEEIEMEEGPAEVDALQVESDDQGESVEVAAEEEPAEEELTEEVGPESRIQEIQASGEEGDEEEEEEDDDFISEHFTEAEVFVKYGLLEKAKEQLLKILGRYPKHVPSHAKLKEIYYDEGDKAKAVDECLTLAEIMKARGQGEEAREQVNEAIRIDPNNPRVKQTASSAAPQAAPAVRPAPAAAAPTPPKSPAPGAKGAAAGTAKPPAAARGARPVPAAPPELEIVEVAEEPAIEIEAETAAADLAIEPAAEAAEPEMEIEIDMGEEEPAPPARKPPPAPAAGRGATAPPARPEKIEEETPEDLEGGLPPGDSGDELTFDIGDDGAAPAAAAPAMGLAGAMRDPDPEKLGEVDFYIDQGLLEEARAVLFQLQKQYPESQEVAQRFERANRPQQEVAVAAPAPPAEEAPGLDLDVERAFGSQTMVMKAPAPAAAPKATPRASKAKPVFKVERTDAEPEGEFFDLAGELDKSLAEAQVAVDTQEQQSMDGPGHSLEEIFKAFKRGVEQQVDSEDYDTHYNLGIAYKEMGLVDEAIGEFQFAAKDPTRTVECCGILGLCFRDKGMPQLALKWYQKGLDMPDIGDQESIGLRYDIAEVHREQADYRKALQLYTEVYGMDSTYRDVAAKVKEMRKLLG